MTETTEATEPTFIPRIVIGICEGSKWRHVGGAVAIVMCHARCAEKGTDLVVFAMSDKILVLPFTDFMGEILVKGSPVPRFERLA